MKIAQILAAFLAFETFQASGDAPVLNYQLNSQLARERDPINNLLKEDSLAGSIGRLTAAACAGVEWVKKGYRRETGPLAFQLHEADMPTDKSMGVQSVVEYKLIGDWLKLNLENDAPLGNLFSPIQTANLLFQVKM